MSWDEISIEDGTWLVRLARENIEHMLEQRNTKSSIDLPEDIPPLLKNKAGIFCTLNLIKGNKTSLRGCIGLIEPENPLVESLLYASRAAAFGDPRFPPLKQESEMDDILVELTILTPPELIVVSHPKELLQEVQIGKHGLIAERGYNKGLLLPQVPIEQEWGVEEFFAHTCWKAGMSLDAWTDERTKFYRFEGIIFSEKEPRGKVIRRIH